MPYVDKEQLKHITRTYETYNDVLARQVAAQRLDELEASIIADRQSRGYQPVRDGDGHVIRWVPTIVEARDIQRMQGGR